MRQPSRSRAAFTTLAPASRQHHLRGPCFGLALGPDLIDVGDGKELLEPVHPDGSEFRDAPAVLLAARHAEQAESVEQAAKVALQVAPEAVFVGGRADL